MKLINALGAHFMNKLKGKKIKIWIAQDSKNE